MINTKAIKKAMIDKDLSVIELSNILNLNVNTVSRWINGNNLNQIDNFLNLLIYLNLDIKEIKKG
jgi:transcriptional regulator with XRE-family HTH domain